MSNASLERLTEACSRLTPADMTTAGKPKTAALARECGVARVSAADRDAAWLAYSRRDSVTAAEEPSPETAAAEEPDDKEAAASQGEADAWTREQRRMAGLD